MNEEVIISCAVTGAGDTAGIHPALPVTPRQIAEAAIDAAQAGAAIAHIHVREPETGAPSRKLAYYREVVERIRESGTDVILNLTTGMGGDLIVDDAHPEAAAPGSDMVAGADPPRACRSPAAGDVHARLRQHELLRRGLRGGGHGRTSCGPWPHACRSSASSRSSRCSTPGTSAWRDKLVDEGLIDGAPLFQLCLGIPYGAPAETRTMAAMVDLLPDDAVWGAFAISRMEMPFVAQSVLLGGNVRVGLEDNLYLGRGVFASNAQLVERAVAIVQAMGARVVSPSDAREKLGLQAAP